MKILILLLLILVSIDSNAQDHQDDFSMILGMALNQKLIPPQLLTDADTFWLERKFNKYVVVKKSDKDKLISTSIQDGDSEIEIWDNEEIFLHNVKYWLTVVHFSIRRQRAKILYETTTYGHVNGKSQCFKGTIVAKRIKEQWTQLEGAYVEINCNFDFFGLPKK